MMPWSAAAQPDIVRAAQKDDLYLQQSMDACHDVVRRAFGAVTALQYSRETKLLATLLYYGLTTGMGLQTLGEEYCDMVQVAGGSGAVPALTLRATLALLKALGPYVGERLAASLGRGSGVYAADAFEEHEAASADAAAAGEAGAASGVPEPDARCAAEAVDASPQVAPPTLPQLLRGWRARARAAWLLARQRASARWPQAQEWLLFAARVHLALFYLHGAYFQPSHRLLGVRYATISSHPGRRTSYRVLGVLLSAQLAVLAASRAHPHLARLGGALVGSDAGQHSQHQQRAAVVLPDEPPAAKGCAGSASSHSASAMVTVEAPPPALTTLGQPRPNCALCLSVRSSPTCTPCGHVFCWRCIVQWCNEKPECPLCRSSVLTPQLVCLAHSDF